MGFTHVKISVQNPARRGKGREVELLIDTGAVSVIPREILKKAIRLAEKINTFARK